MVPTTRTRSPAARVSAMFSPELPERRAGVPGGFVVDPLPRVVLAAPVDQHGEFGDPAAGGGEPDLGVVGEVALEGDGRGQHRASPLRVRWSGGLGGTVPRISVISQSTAWGRKITFWAPICWARIQSSSVVGVVADQGDVAAVEQVAAVRQEGCGVGLDEDHRRAGPQVGVDVGGCVFDDLVPGDGVGDQFGRAGVVQVVDDVQDAGHG
jgi:hypothetical protein